MSLIPLFSRRFLSLSGDGCLNFLQGLVTQDVLTLQSGKAIYTLFLTPKGRYETDFFIIHKGKEIILDIIDLHFKSLSKKLNFYKMRRNIKIRDVSNYWRMFICTNRQNFFYKKEEDLLFNDPRTFKSNKRILRLTKHNKSYQTKLNINLYENFRINLGIPETNKDLLPGKTIPLEANMEFLNAISWSKKCYLGQELTARTYYQGNVRKRLLPIHTKGPYLKPKSNIFYKKKKIGIFSSGNKNIGLALLQLKYVLNSIKSKEFLWSGDTQINPYIPYWLKLKNLS